MQSTRRAVSGAGQWIYCHCRRRAAPPASLTCTGTAATVEAVMGTAAAVAPRMSQRTYATSAGTALRYSGLDRRPRKKDKGMRSPESTVAHRWRAQRSAGLAAMELQNGEKILQDALDKQEDEDEAYIQAEASCAQAPGDTPPLSETSEGWNSGADEPSAAAVAEEEAAAPGKPPPPVAPQRRVRRYFIPGIDDAEADGATEPHTRSGRLFQLLSGKSSLWKESVLPSPAGSPTARADATEHPSDTQPAGPAAAAGPPPAAASEHEHAEAGKGDPSPSVGDKTAAVGSHGTASEASAAAKSVVTADGSSVPPSTPSSSAPASSSHTAPEGKIVDASAAAQPTPPAARGSASPDAKTGLSPIPATEKSILTDDDMYDDDDLRVMLPHALVRGQTSKAKKIKTLLMAALGSDFAKAGMYNDGVRTSFSVVSYQAVKARTGLKTIPAKLVVSCLTAPDKLIDWIDITAHPTATLLEYKEAIQEILVGLGMHSTMVDDSTEPMLLPQVTISKDCHSLLMRYAIDVQGNKRMDSFQDLTNRFTLFLTDKRVITVHRTQCMFVEELKRDWQEMLESERGAVPKYLLYYFVRETVQTFMRAISKCIVEFDRYEAGLFVNTRSRSSLAREIYHIKRRASVYGRTLTLTKDAYAHMASSVDVYPSHLHYQEIAHDLAHMESLAEELNANADSVLQLLFQLSSYQVNELMRVLTLFSAFFIPLTFIAGVYGMNFDSLPLLHAHNGEVYCAGLMCIVATFIFYWFKSKHFI